MAKDDYYVIVYKILAYLYVQLKAGEPVDPKLISADSQLLEINDTYWTYIMENLSDQGYVRNIKVERPWGKEPFIKDLEYCQITPAGIAYLCDNSLLEKAKQFLKDVKAITPFI